MTEIARIIVDAIPNDFDPDRHPIIAEHFFGWCRLGDVTAGIIRDLQRRHRGADEGQAAGRSRGDGLNTGHTAASISSPWTQGARSNQGEYERL